MITASNVNVYVGARLLLGEVGFRVSPGDKIGLVGRNGAGKTTLTKILAGEVPPSSGTVSRLGSVGHLPQDPRTGDLSVTAASRIMSARGVGAAAQELRRAESAMATATGAAQDRAMRAYVRAEEAFLAAGGYAAEAEAAQLAAGLGLPDRVLAQPLGSGGGSSWPGSWPPATTLCCSTSPPTTWTPTPSAGCAASWPAIRAASS
jgi:ATPase subunit of ABC transporter with duplicated ATPase domains